MTFAKTYLNGRVVFGHDFIEANGKTTRENNLTITHKIPIGTLVEYSRVDGDDSKYWGIRLYVLDYSRDCDGTPLYILGPREAAKYEQWGGFAEQSLTAITPPQPEAKDGGG